MKKLSFVVIFLLLCITGSSYAADYHYATTDMTWAEFYAGETGSTSKDLKDAGLDAVSSSTTRIAGRFSSILVTEIKSADAGAASTDGKIGLIKGVKAVQVRMSSDVYEALSKDSRYKFSTTAFTEFKDVNADGSFGAMSSDTTKPNATVTLSSGPSATWGSYMLDISADIVLSSGDTRYDLGAVIETKEGNKYGLRHNSNLWFNAEHIAFTVDGSYREPHGVKRDYAYTADLPGQTITKITYILKDKPDAVIDGLNIYVKDSTDATVKPSNVPSAGYYTAEPGTNLTVTFAFDGLPDDTSAASYDITSLYAGSGRSRTAITKYTYANNTLTVSADILTLGGTYTAVFGKNSKYIDRSAAFTFVPKYSYATTNMTWAEFYAGEVSKTASVLEADGLDAISTPTTAPAISRFPLLWSVSNDKGTVISGEKAVQVRMTEAVYLTKSNDKRYTFSAKAFKEFKEVSADGSFGKMSTDITQASNAKVTISSGSSSRWGNYTLKISGASIDIGLSDDKIARKYLGALIETSDGTIYGMRHDNNLWSTAEDIAFCVSSDYTEPHGRGVTRDYDYTASLAGKTIRKITFMLKDIPDVVISCDVLVKNFTGTKASAKEPADGWLEAMGDVSIPLALTGTPSDAAYTVSAVAAVEGRKETAIDAGRYEYKDGVLTFKGGITAGNYKVTFSDSKYADIAGTFTIYTTDATGKIISPDANNAGGVQFLLTPAGAVSSVDKFMASSDFVAADAYTSPDKNFSAEYNPSGAVTGSGFSFDIVLNGVPSGKTAVVGVGKMFYFTPDNCGTNFSAILSKISNDVPVGESGYHEISDGKTFRDMGLRVVSVYGNGLSRDVTEYVGAGAMISDDKNILLFYGIMLADRDITADDEGKEYLFSPEGETLISDGAKDDHLKAAWYFEKTNIPGTTPGTGETSGNAEQGETTPGDTTPGGSENVPGGSTVYRPDTPSAPKANVSQSTIISALSSALGSSVTIPSNVRIVSGYTPSTKGITVTQRDLGSNEELAFVVGEVTVEEDTIYSFNAQLKEDVTEGWLLVWKLLDPASINSTEFKDAAEEGSAAVFFDSTGQQITKVPAGRNVDVSAFFKAGGTYSPVITAANPDTDNGTGPGDGSGGCSGFDSLAPAMMLAVLFVLRRR